VIDHYTIEKIIDTADIVDVVQDFVTLKKRGANYVGLCPFHNEKTPSFNVSPSRGIYKCFGCGKGGNVVNFIMEHEHMNYPEALKYLAGKYHIEVVEKEQTAEELQQQNERESLMVVTSFAQKYFTETLFNHQEGRDIGLTYFKERGFREDVIRKFQLGYSREEKNAFSKEALKQNFKKEVLVKVGLSVERNDDLVDRFNGRVIFPIHGLSGNVLGFGGRVLRSDEKTAKYVNSPESELYHKSRIVYGIYHARKAIVNMDRCYLVEGYTDVLSLHQSGIENVVASSGTSLTSDQIRLIKRFTSNVTILYDGDEAGIKASLRGVDLLLEEGLNVKVILIPDGEDPDSYSRKLSQQQFKDFLAIEEKDFITFKVNLLVEEARNDPVKRANLITDIVRSVAVISDRIKRTVYIKECSVLLGIDERVLYQEVYKRRRKAAEDRMNRPRQVVEEDIPFRSTAVPSFVDEIFSEPQERELIRLLLYYGEKKLYPIEYEGEEEEYITVAEYIIHEIQNDELEFKNLVYRQVFEEYQKNLNSGHFPDSKYFINHEDRKIREMTADMLSTPYTLSKVHARKGAFVETEEMKLKKMVPETLVSYKTKILRLAQKGKEKKLKDAMEKGLAQEEITKIQKEYMIITAVINNIAHDRGGWVVVN
jgi:DNA primase